MSVRSMTGFARVRKALADGEIILSLKSVNHRGLDMHFHLPVELEAFEGALRSGIKKRVARGHVQIHAGYTRPFAAGAATLNRPLLDAYMAAFREAAGQYGTGAVPDLNAALRVPGMFRTDLEEEAGAEVEAVLLALLEDALDTLDRFREREGAAIAAEMRQRCGTICDQVSRMEEIRGDATPAFQKRLRERLGELLEGVGLDPQRLAQEAALLADRSDISEELVRLKTHAAQLDRMLAGSGEVGKRLDFLLQEMNRETNTILSKTGGTGDLGLTITDLALAAKSEIDKIREQSLNLE